MEVMILYTKWGDDIVSNERGMEWAALDVVRLRLEQGFYYDNWDDGDPDHQWEDRAKGIVETDNAYGALDFLEERDEFEYEGFEIKAVKT